MATTLFVTGRHVVSRQIDLLPHPEGGCTGVHALDIDGISTACFWVADGPGRLALKWPNGFSAKAPLL
jgi:hypothetical protein